MAWERAPQVSGVQKLGRQELGRFGRFFLEDSEQEAYRPIRPVSQGAELHVAGAE